jgi:hypothetical protein
MNEDKGTGSTPPEQDEPRTAVEPAGDAVSPDAPAASEPAEEERTVIAPAASTDHAGEEERTVIAPAASP